jgi:hypothetical protein
MSNSWKIAHKGQRRHSPIVPGTEFVSFLEHPHRNPVHSNNAGTEWAGLRSPSPSHGAANQGTSMKRLLLIGLSACALGVFTLSASAMPLAAPNALIVGGDDNVILARGGHGHGGHHMGRGGRGHHYGWGRGRGHHYGWGRGRGRHWH